MKVIENRGRRYIPRIFLISIFSHLGGELYNK
jgi:hypothetical protein